MIRLSQSALGEVLRLKSKQSNPEAVLRLGVQLSGCAGLSYQLTFSSSLQSDDRVYEANGVQVVIDVQSLPYVAGLTVDYSEDLMGGNFRFHNPNATQTCGCGQSFAVENQ